MEWIQYIDVLGSVLIVIGVLYIFCPKYLIKMTQNKKRLHLILNRRPRLVIGSSLIILGLISFIYPLLLET